MRTVLSNQQIDVIHTHTLQFFQCFVTTLISGIMADNHRLRNP